MSFSKLSIELIQRIIRFTIPDSFENAAATCKLLYMASRFLVDEYRKTKRFQHFRYSRHCSERDYLCEAANLPGGVHMSCKNPQHWDEATAVSGIKIANAIGLLQAIAREPDLAWHIQSLDLKDPDRHLWQAENQPSFTQATTQDVQNLHRLYRAAMPSDSETGGEDFALWMKHITPFLADIFILNLVPNVVEIALSKSWGRVDIVNAANLELLDAMVGRANDPTVRDAPLAQLAVVKPYVGHGWDAHGCLTPLASFLALNSVREFYMGGVQAFSDNDTDIPFSPRHAVYGNSLKKIELNGSAVGPRALSALLSRTPQLECFHLGLESKPGEFGGRYNIGHLLAIICAHVGGSLKDLALHNNSLEIYTYTLTNMHGFTRLQILELDINSLCGPEFSATELLPSGRFDEYFPRFPADARPALPRLVDLLPPSLVAFMLGFSTVLQRSPTTDNEYVFFRLPELLAGFRDERSTKLPRLSDIVFDPPFDIERYAEKNRDRKFANSIHSILREAETCGVRWERGTFSCFRTFNDRFDVKNVSEDY
ncbi:hypothetical protein G7Y89_g6237 [Cudoniella acicularis]|uniref:F-box domain-containing protein n=1 Tax=Cudoniella acicularis TaxID=354080 RepID=A0A8H4RNB1_9HELO|nr:hypothetical protein G7Y89_g6237 [Cudoniella acicularis]